MSEEITIGASTISANLADGRDYLERHLIVCCECVYSTGTPHSDEEAVYTRHSHHYDRPATTGSESTRSADHVAGSAAASRNCDHGFPNDLTPVGESSLDRRHGPAGPTNRPGTRTPARENPRERDTPMTLVARPLAGPGNPGNALNVLERQGWNTTHDEVGNAYLASPDQRVIAAFLPERNDFAPAGPLWVIRGYGGLNAVEWEATFTDKTPAEFIAAFLTDLTAPGPLDPERDEEDIPATPCNA